MLQRLLPLNASSMVDFRICVPKILLGGVAVG